MAKEITTIRKGALKRWEERVNLAKPAPDRFDQTTVRNFLDKDPKFLEREIFPTFDNLITDYNNPTISDENKSLLWAASHLKQKIARLPTIADMLSESKIKSRWVRNFLKAIDHMNTAMRLGERLREANPNKDLFALDSTGNELFFNYSPTQPSAITLGAVYHAYEETVLQDQELKQSHPWKKDEIVDALIEILILNHRQSKVFELTKNAWSENNSGGLNWVDKYDHINPKLREVAGCS